MLSLKIKANPSISFRGELGHEKYKRKKRREISPEQKQEIKEAFELFDTDKDQRIDYHELKVIVIIFTYSHDFILLDIVFHSIVCNIFMILHYLPKNQKLLSKFENCLEDARKTMTRKFSDFNKNISKLNVTFYAFGQLSYQKN